MRGGQPFASLLPDAEKAIIGGKSFHKPARVEGFMVVVDFETIGPLVAQGRIPADFLKDIGNAASVVFLRQGESVAAKQVPHLRVCNVEFDCVFKHFAVASVVIRYLHK